jgi:hypothetical protein
MFEEIQHHPIVQLKDEEIRSIFGTGKIITVYFIKSDGSKRVLNGRSGVKKHLKGGKLPYCREKTRTIGLFELKSKAYKSIRIDRIVYFKANGKLYRLI